MGVSEVSLEENAPNNVAPATTLPQYSNEELFRLLIGDTHINEVFEIIKRKVRMDRGRMKGLHIVIGQKGEK